jgi:hypothetical protein
MISRMIPATAIAAIFASSAAFAQMPAQAPSNAPTPPQSSSLTPDPMTEATQGATTSSGAALPQTAPIPADEAQPATPPDTIPGTTTTAAVGVPVPSGQSVAEIANAGQTLRGATVQSADGATIGTVQSVTTDPGGAAQKVTVAVSASANIPAHRLGIAASDLHYQQNGNLVVAELTQQELQDVAAARTPGDVAP